MAATALLLAPACDQKIVAPADDDADGDGFDEGEDCDDADASTHPASVEVCDALDNDCDGAVDEGLEASTWHLDADGDGFGDPAAAAEACAAPAGYVEAGDAPADCDDGDAEVHPGAEEVCDGGDQDCDDAIDEGLDPIELVWLMDADGDGWGDDDDAACRSDGGRVLEGGDCDDSDPSVHPGAEEVCDDVDNDCDGTNLGPWPAWPDADSDGWGDEALGEEVCEMPRGWVEVGGDCDDGDPAVHPGAEEVCDGADNDCDGGVDGPVVDTALDDYHDAARWHLNGSANYWWTSSGGYIELTSAGNYQSGTAWLDTRVPADGWSASFTAEIGGGDGADGMAFAFLAEEDTGALGSYGLDLGLAGLDGYAFEWDTYANEEEGDPAGVPHYALMDVAAWSWLVFDTALPFRGAPVAVEIIFDDGDYEVWMDGVLALSGWLDVSHLDTVMVGFAAGTGGSNDRHTVDDVTIACF